MSAPEGNTFWKDRYNHGRDKKYETAQALWDESVKYFEYTDTRVWNKVEYKGSDVTEVHIPTSAPYTLTGLRLYLGISRTTWSNYKVEEDYLSIITRIEDIVYTQKFEGAAVGAYNSNIIARDLGLIDKTEETGSVSISITREVKAPEDGAES